MHSASGVSKSSQETKSSEKQVMSTDVTHWLFDGDAEGESVGDGVGGVVGGDVGSNVTMFGNTGAKVG